MCGIAGIFSINRGHLGMTEALARRMADTLIHRGPDDTGVWLDRNAGIALAHRRLSILDLSSSGHQPMVSETGRWSIAFNGEIYNHLVLREELKTAGAATWRGHSDTETLLACIETWGLEKTLRQIVGMFALALWDSKNRFLWLARDRMGEKPLYYGWSGGVFLFASELKALAQHRRGGARSTAAPWRFTCAIPSCRRPIRSSRASPSCCRATP